MRDIGMASIVEHADQLGVLSPDHFWFGGVEDPNETAHYWTGLFDISIRALTSGMCTRVLDDA